MPTKVFNVRSTRSDVAERMEFITEEYLLSLAADLQASQPGEAILVGSESGYEGGRKGGKGDPNGKGVASNVANEVKRQLGKLTNLNTKVHAIKDPEGGAFHYAALSLNRSQPDYAKAIENPVKRERKSKDEAAAAKPEKADK
jgi:hypothetical protein